MSSRPFFFNFRFRLYTVNRRMTDRTYFIQVVKRIDSCILSTRYKIGSSIVAESWSWSRFYIRWCLFRSRRHTVLSLNHAPAVRCTASLSVQPHQRQVMQTSSFIVIGIDQPIILLRLLHTLHAQFWQRRCSAYHFSSVCVSSLQAIVLYTHGTTLRNVLITAKNTIVRYEWFCKPSLYTWFCIPSYTWFCIPPIVIHGIVHLCKHGFVYHHSLYVVLYTIVYMVLYTITRYTWFEYHCIPGAWFCIRTIVRYGFVYHRWL